MTLESVKGLTIMIMIVIVNSSKLKKALEDVQVKKPLRQIMETKNNRKHKSKRGKRSSTQASEAPRQEMNLFH